MAVTTAVLSGNITDLTGDLNASYLKRVVIVVEANTPGSMLLDTDGNRIMAGAKRVTIDTTTGAYTITLPKTDSADIFPPGARLYKVTLIYPNGTPGAGNVTLQSGWWPLTADGSLSDADKWPGLEVTVVSQAVLDSIADMAADVEDRWTDVMGVVATTDGLMTSVLGSGGTFDAEMDATYVAYDEPGFDLILLLGQSNMSGRGTPYDAFTDPTDGRVFQYGATGSNSRQIIQASEPLLMHDTPTGIGPGLGFGRWYANPASARNRRVLLVPAAHGSTGFETSGEFTWKIGNTTQTNLYDLALAQTRDALVAAGPGSRVVAALWHQGENDGNISVSQATYTADLEALIDQLRADLALPNLPFVIGQLVPENITGGMVAIDAAHQAIAASDPDVVFAHSLPGATLVGDINHGNSTWQRFMARAMFDEASTLLFGTDAPTVPAQVTGFAAATSNPSTALTVSWTAIPNAIGYYIEYRTAAGPGAWTAGPGTTTALSGTVSGLTANTSYNLRVRAANSAGLGAWSSTVTASTPNPTLVFSDTVTRANAAAGGLGTPDIGAAWSDPSTKFGIISNTAYHPATTSVAGTYATAETSQANGEFGVKFAAIPTAGSALMRFLFRYSDSSNFWLVQHRRSTGKYQLYRTVAGNATQIGADFTATPTAGDIINVVAYGSSIQVYVNGALQVSATDSFNSTATKIGFGHGTAVSAADVARWDNFTVYV